MPINTAEKRRNASAVGHRIGGRGITPNASKDQEWRQQVGWGYGGIAASAEVPFTFDTVCPLPIPLVARTPLEIPMLARDPLAVPLVGCRNEA